MVKIDVSDVKKNTVLDIDGGLYKVIDMSHTHMWRGGATDSFKIKNLVTGGTKNVTYNSGSMVEKAEVITKNAMYLYKAWDTYSFMENDTGEMHELDKEKIEDVVPYLKENLDLFLMTHEGNVLSVLLPATITYEIASTVPGIKWDRSKTGKKPATLETGIELQIPLHKEAGQTVVLNTLTGEAS